jgi:hypothetical protein
MKIIFNKVEYKVMKASFFIGCFAKVILIIKNLKKGGIYAIRR